MVAAEVIAWFQKAFDCSAAPLHIPGPKLESIAEWWCSHLFDMPATEAERVRFPKARPYNYQKLGLVFAVPQVKEISDICIDMKSEDLMNVYGMYVQGKEKGREWLEY